MAEIPQVALRRPDRVMRLDRMGASHPTRLSFMRQLIRTLNSTQVNVSRELWEFDPRGYGQAVYSLEMGGFRYSLCAFSNPLDEKDRTDRVIAEAWDTTFVLRNGIPDKTQLERIRRNAVRQEAGRYGPDDLVLSRANKSVRMFELVAQNLAGGRQPDAESIRKVGYLMRTTAVYGNGKFGLADRSLYASRPALASPFQAEMLTVWLIRGFTHDLVQHVAYHRNPDDFVPLAPRVSRQLGIGNATGLGMAPFLIGHPILIHNWVLARETALARVLAIERTDSGKYQRFIELLARALTHIQEMRIEDECQRQKNAQLLHELAELESYTLSRRTDQPYPWRNLLCQSGSFSLECQELLVSLIIEPHGELVDELGLWMASEANAVFDPSMPVSLFKRVFDRNCGWIQKIDFERPEAARLFWYVSEEKLEPRLGDKARDIGSERALPLDTAHQYHDLGKALSDTDQSRTMAEFVSDYPEFRHTVRRLQTVDAFPYAEIYANLIELGMRPIELLRCKLAFFGATKFDPKSDLWTRITMYQGAPDFKSIVKTDADDWSFPAIG